ncbi:MAG TPA: ACP S-malonyltransferase [Vicinamibacterales bacterium]|nr:ACP S-malonyltransferase [Vicinamibacterales bacterium]
MSARIAFVFPGQGSQAVGMGTALAAAFPEAEAALAEAETAFAGAANGAANGVAAHVSLRAMLADGPEDRLTLTEHAQPALVAVSVAAARVLAAHGIEPAFVAGHSLGEYSAHVAAGTFSLADGVSIVRRRGRYMQESVPVGTGAMAAVLGLDTALVEQACREAADGEVVSPANLNAPGQVAIAGHAGAVARASERARALGARRVVPLAVSAPFHCALMQPAQARLEPELRALRATAPRVPVVANVDAEPKRDAHASVDALVQQVSSRVRWVEVVQRLAAEGVTHYIEVGPGNVLAGFIKRIHKDAHIVSFSSPDQLDAVRAACSS